MIRLVKIISTELVERGRRLIKVLRLGKQDVQTPIQAGPFGSDVNPPPGVRGIYVRTGTKGDTFLVGFINIDQVAEVGENRQFATDENGALIFEARMRNDGTYEIGGSADNLMRFTGLDTQMQKLSSDINAELVKIASGITTGGGVYTPAPIGIDISSAKIEELKTS